MTSNKNQASANFIQKTGEKEVCGCREITSYLLSIEVTVGYTSHPRGTHKRTLFDGTKVGTYTNSITFFIRLRHSLYEPALSDVPRM